MNFFETIRTFLMDESYRKLLGTTMIILAVGTVVFHFLENWSWLDSFYFSIITLTTIGYGDFSPQTEIGKIFTIMYIIVGVGVILNFIQIIHVHYQDNATQRSEKKKRENRLKG